MAILQKAMIHTPVCGLLGIRHPIVLGGMAGSTSVPLVAAVSNAGGLGTPYCP
jgi:enoyl-[acyl-carrier protein] reductase II